MRTWFFTLSLFVLLAGTSALEAGRYPMPGRDAAVCPPHTSIIYDVQFRPGEPATLWVTGNGVSDLDVYVYDPMGRMAAYGNTPTDRERVTFIAQPGVYRVVVSNIGAVPNAFHMVTD